MVDTYTPLTGSGRPWNEIPFCVCRIGIEQRLCGILLRCNDMAVLNLAHYRNSADYEDSVFSTGSRSRGWPG